MWKEKFFKKSHPGEKCLLRFLLERYFLYSYLVLSSLSFSLSGAKWAGSLSILF